MLVVVRSAVGMPLSEDQISALKNGETIISIQTENPKKAGSKAWERFEKYKHATTIAEAMGNSANWQDLSGDFEKGYMKIVDTGDATMTSSTKRSAPEGTPDREAHARAKLQPTQLVPQVLVPEVLDPVHKVEMSAATIAALRSMMREEFRHGMAEMEQMLAGKIESSVDELRKEIACERDARQHLEQRIAHLEVKHLNSNMPDSDAETVDKSMAVIGGFAADALEDAEKIVLVWMASAKLTWQVPNKTLPLQTLTHLRRPCNLSGRSGPTQSCSLKNFGLPKIGPVQRGCVAKWSAKSKSS